ncbi:VirB4 family type IV secretion system protein [Candidatus Nitrosocaldus islandicus]|uniref:VirB4 family type IV secretion system protein n=1 Tax=Candidatus Nitrosocaldus islandicus TaxID=2045011 RepID=UPI000CD1071D|nr:ATP-binding protein [Candidatus Nitrosocaldus islandicus]
MMIIKKSNNNKNKKKNLDTITTTAATTTALPSSSSPLSVPFLKDCYIYEIKSLSNFFVLNEEKQHNLIIRFLQFINNATVLHSLHMLIYRDSIQYHQRIYPVIRVFIASKDLTLEHLLMNSEYKYSKVQELPFFSNIKGVREYATYLKLHPNEVYARIFSLTALPSTLYQAWIFQLLNHCDLLLLTYKRVEQATAVSSVIRLASMLKATQSRKLELKIQRAEQLREALVRQETSLFKLSLNAVITARDKQELITYSKSFKRSMKAQLVKFVAYPFKQYSMLYEGEGKELYIELGSLAITYPFVSSDMLELDGIMLGENIVTKAPILYDYRVRDNYNCLILATSGAGKSVTAKLLLTRLLSRYPNAYCYVIDPQGEYERLQGMLGASVIRLTGYEQLGLDPFLLFDKVEVADIIADIAEAPDTIRKELRSVSQYCNTIFDLYEKCSDNAKLYLVDLVNSPISLIFKGKTMLQQRNILSLKGAYAGEAKVTMLLILALARAWKQINSLPANIPKILVIDEGWMLFTMHSTARFVNLIARVGRKLNVIFIFITQRPEDVIANEYGRALLDNADTKILLRNNELASAKISEALQLSNEEKNLLVNFMRGEALLLTREYRLRIQIKPTEEELQLFSTSPISI